MQVTARIDWNRIFAPRAPRAPDPSSLSVC
jgi:hypothetical protein